MNFTKEDGLQHKRDKWLGELGEFFYKPSVKKCLLEDYRKRVCDKLYKEKK